MLISDIPLFLYLNQHSHAETWCTGGQIPLTPASFYRSQERAGIYTPDEVEQCHTQGLPAGQAAHEIASLFGGGTFSFVGASVSIGGFSGVLDCATISKSEQDSLILSFSRTFSKDQATRFGGKVACVRLLDISRLKGEIDAQLGTPGELRVVEYTKSPNRNTFLKSHADMWQAEVRLSWPVETAEVRWVEIGSGLAVPMSFDDHPEVMGEDRPLFVPFSPFSPPTPPGPTPKFLDAWARMRRRHPLI